MTYGRQTHAGDILLPPSVAAAVDRYFALLTAENTDVLRGIYLVGSVALGDYQDGRSDIDFAAVTAVPLGHEEIAILARVHAAMTGIPSFDGLYIAADRLAETPRPDLVTAFVQDGHFRVGPSFEANPATWQLWARHGIALKGPPPGELALPLDEATLQRFEIANLGTYWRHWIDRMRASISANAATDRVDAGMVAWGVLGVARIACALATGRIVSKTEAGRWALTQDAWQHAPVLETALAARRGEIVGVRLEEALIALAVMEEAIERLAHPLNTPPLQTGASVPFLLRSARDEDRAALGALKLRSSLAWGDHVEELLALPEAREVPLAHMPHAIAAERDGTIVGFATVLAGKDGEAELEDLFVAPEQWRTGVGSKLLAEAERRAVDGGARVLHVVAGERARPFYEASGFRFVGTVATAFEPATELDKDLSRDDRLAPRPRQG